MLFGVWEMVLVAVVALLVLGPDKLPEAMRKAGRAFSLVRKMTDEVRQNLDDMWQEDADTRARPHTLSDHPSQSVVITKPPAPPHDGAERGNAPAAKGTEKKT